jgi:hypothetical protein
VSEKTEAAVSRRRFLAPLALAQFICSFAGSNMNVMINDITKELPVEPRPSAGAATAALGTRAASP